MVHWTSSHTIKQTFRHRHRCVHIHRERERQWDTDMYTQTYTDIETETIAKRQRGWLKDGGERQACKIHVHVCTFTAYSSIQSISPSYYTVSICRSSIPFHNGHSNTKSYKMIVSYGTDIMWLSWAITCTCHAYPHDVIP